MSLLRPAPRRLSPRRRAPCVSHENAGVLGAPELGAPEDDAPPRALPRLRRNRCPVLVPPVALPRMVEHGRSIRPPMRCLCEDANGSPEDFAGGVGRLFGF